jgi:hypothetical protein
MEIIFNSVQTPKPTQRNYALIKDRVFIALVFSFSVLTVIDQTQAYQSLQFSLQSMLQMIGLLHNPLKRTKASSCCQSSFDANSKVKVFWRFWQNGLPTPLAMEAPLRFR